MVRYGKCTICYTGSTGDVCRCDEVGQFAKEKAMLVFEVRVANGGGSSRLVEVVAPNVDSARSKAEAQNPGFRAKGSAQIGIVGVGDYKNYK